MAFSGETTGDFDFLIRTTTRDIAFN